MRFTTQALLLGLAQLARSQGLGEELLGALKDTPDTSLFKQLLQAAPQFVQTVVGDKTSGITVLVPDDQAVTTFLSVNNQSDFSALLSDSDAIIKVFRYHVLVSDVSQEAFASELGLTVPTLLKDEKFNNRTPGAALTGLYGDDATGQVLYFSKAAIPVEIKKRQGDNEDLKNAIINVRAGLQMTAKMKLVDGSFGSSNKYQLVDEVLVAPQNCETTIQAPEKSGSQKLKALDAALTATGLYPALNTSPNVTCLAPSSDAFEKAGLDYTKFGDLVKETEGKKTLTDALLFHTLKEVTYTNFLKNGQKIETLSGDTVTVTIDGKDIYFNNAKVKEPNVLTNNGLIQALESVMEKDGKPPTSTGDDTDDGGDEPSSTDSEDSSPSATESAETTTGAASSLRAGAGLVVALAAGLALV